MNIELMMKAVNGLKGDLINTKDHEENTDKYNKLFILKSSNRIFGEGTYSLDDKNHSPDKWRFVCFANDFNNLVSELSNWQPTLPKVETVEYEGNIYEVGKKYEFSDSGDEWVTGDFDSISDGVSYPFGSDLDVYRYCREISKICLGTITPAPTKLIDNNVYTFELNCDLWTGFYRESRGSFFTQLVGGNKICSASEASHITHLTEAK